jgi:hypothetical protein
MLGTTKLPHKPEKAKKLIDILEKTQEAKRATLKKVLTLNYL